MVKYDLSVKTKIPMGTSFSDFQKIAEELKIDFVSRPHTREDGHVYTVVNISDEVGIAPFIQGRGRVSEEYFDLWLEEGRLIKIISDFYTNVPMGTSFSEFQKQAEEQNFKPDCWLSEVGGEKYALVNYGTELPILFFTEPEGRVDEEHFKTWLRSQGGGGVVGAEFTLLHAQVDDNGDITRFLVDEMTDSVEVNEDGVTVRVISDEFNSDVMTDTLNDPVSTTCEADSRWLEQRQAEWNLQMKGLISSSQEEPIPDFLYEEYKIAFDNLTQAGLALSRVGTCDLYPPTTHSQK